MRIIYMHVYGVANNPYGFPAWFSLRGAHVERVHSAGHLHADGSSRRASTTVDGFWDGQIIA